MFTTWSRYGKKGSFAWERRENNIFFYKLKQNKTVTASNGTRLIDDEKLLENSDEVLKFDPHQEKSTKNKTNYCTKFFFVYDVSTTYVGHIVTVHVFTSTFFITIFN